MKTQTIARLAALSLGLGMAGLVFACSSDDSSGSNPAPTTHDSGTTNQVDGSNPNPGDDSGPQPGTDSGVDSNLPDVGTCTSDASTCNSCYTPSQDPVNGCSPATVNCIPFDNTRVPANAP